MTARKAPCAGVNQAGEPCQSPLVGGDGFCPAHRPGGQAEMRRRGLKGAIASRSCKGLSPDELPPLRSPEDAERWAEIVGRAVSQKRLTHSEGRAVASLIREFLKAHSDGKVTRRIKELGEAVSKLRVES